MSPETITAIQKALLPVAERIGQGAMFVWETVVRQQQIEAISMFMWSAVVLLAVVMFVWFAVLCAREAKKKSNDEYYQGMTFFLLVALGALIVTGALVFEGIAHLMNPAYYALEFFITLGQSAAGG